MKIMTLLISLLFLVSCKQKVSKTTLVVFTYSSFQSHFGPGGDLAKDFEESCNCKVKLKNIGEAGLMLNRLRLEKQAPDVVVGLDQFSLKEAGEKFKWVSVSLNNINLLPDFKVNDKAKFIPLNWSPLTFLYRKNEITPVDSLGDLLNYDKKILLQDPSASSPGFHFFNWVDNNFTGDVLRSYFGKLKKATYKISPSWTTAYGLFENKKAPIVFTYLTSLVYHWKDQKDLSIGAMAFAEPHPVQVEYVAIPESGKNIKLAKQFVRYLLSEKSQKIIMQKNYMLPVVSGVTVGTHFEKLPKLNTANIESAKEINRKQKIKQWLSILGE